MPTEIEFDAAGGELASDRAAIVKAILDTAWILGDKMGEEHGVWALLAAVACMERGVNLLPRQTASSLAILRKHVDRAIKQIGEENADVTSIILEMHVK